MSCPVAQKQQRIARSKASAKRRETNRARARKRGHRRVRARRIVKGARYKITKKCLEGRFFLVPDSDEVTQIIGFCLGLALDRFEIELHAAVFMSNHYHLDVTDPKGEMPAFKCMLNSFIARALNAHRGRYDKFWSGDAACDVELLDDEDVIDGMAYTVTNPPKSGLVKRGHRWPGLTTAGKKFGDVMRFERPDQFFDPENDAVPNAVEIRIVRPRIREKLSDDELQAVLDEAVRERELKAARKMRAQHRRFLGESRIRRQKWNRTASSYNERYTQTPSVSARNKWARIAALQRNADWDAEYARAYEAKRAGKDVEFPHGTYAMHRFAGARVAQAPP
jgi:hypothetical protein